MPNVASWIREKDEPYFKRFFRKRGGLRLFNARVRPVNMANMDALLLTGGEDIDAAYLKQRVPDPSVIEEPQPHRDAWEFAALPQALEAGKPVLAVCKGHQVLNVVLGGTLHLDIRGHGLPEQKLQNIQSLRYAPRVPASRRFKLVNSSHHQAIKKLGDGLVVEAWSTKDDIIEQVRLRRYPFCIGVQYHPERSPIYESLFNDFFDRIDGRL
jgi:putative glutamine amidotransferase